MCVSVETCFAARAALRRLPRSLPPPHPALRSLIPPSRARPRRPSARRRPQPSSRRGPLCRRRRPVALVVRLGVALRVRAPVTVAVPVARRALRPSPRCPPPSGDVTSSVTPIPQHGVRALPGAARIETSHSRVSRRHLLAPYVCGSVGGGFCFSSCCRRGAVYPPRQAAAKNLVRLFSLLRLSGTSRLTLDVLDHGRVVLVSSALSGTSVPAQRRRPTQLCQVWP